MYFFTDVNLHLPSAITLPFVLHRNEIPTMDIILNFYLPVADKIFSKWLLYQQFCETKSSSQLVNKTGRRHGLRHWLKIVCAVYLLARLLVLVWPMSTSTAPDRASARSDKTKTLHIGNLYVVSRFSRQPFRQS